jgi:FlaA1/EpsC-like NDP-sugar epimerase
MRLQPPGSRYCAVRFGNVAGSRGSVIPTFARQILSGGPVTVTDPEMKRFFMSVHEAVQLVLQAATMAEGGEVFMLEMGEPVRILELAERMVRLSGRNVGTDVQVLITGARPGEKLEEVLKGETEAALPTEHRSIVRLLPEALPRVALDAGVEQLGDLVRRRADTDIRRLLFALVDGSFRPAPTVIDVEALTFQRPALQLATG